MRTRQAQQFVSATARFFRARWRSLAALLLIPLLYLYLYDWVATPYDPPLAGMKEPNRLPALMTQADPPVRNLNIHPLRPGDLTQLVTLDVLVEEKVRGRSQEPPKSHWVESKAWVDVPIRESGDQTLNDYVKRLRREGRLAVRVRQAGWQRPLVGAAIILLAGAIVASVVVPVLKEAFRKLPRVARKEPRRATAFAPAPQPEKPNSGLEGVPDLSPAPPSLFTAQPPALPARQPEDEKEYSGEWYPVARDARAAHHPR